MADRVHELKETEKGVEHMCKEMEALRLEGVEEGRMEEKKAVAYSLADRKMSAEEIAELSLLEIRIWSGYYTASGFRRKSHSYKVKSKVGGYTHENCNH